MTNGDRGDEWWGFVSTTTNQLVETAGDGLDKWQAVMRATGGGGRVHNQWRTITTISGGGNEVL